jgi:hypothetical protein
MWFIVLAFVVNGRLGAPVPSIATWRFPTREACMAEAKERVRGMQAIMDTHGRYLCMYHDEPEAELTRRGGVVF